MKKFVFALAASSLVLAGCAGRQANPVQVVQPGDAEMSCSELRQSIELNQRNLNRLLDDQKATRQKNTAAAAVGAIVFFPALFFMDLKGAAGEEAKAMRDRVHGLADRHNNKGCKPEIQIMDAES